MLMFQTLPTLPGSSIIKAWGRERIPRRIQTMTHTPAAWNLLRSKVQAATAHMTDSELTSRICRQQRRWRTNKSAACFDVMQELLAEKRRRQFA